MVVGVLNPNRSAPAVTWRCTRCEVVRLLRRDAPVMCRCTRYVAMHRLCVAAPVTSRCTRTEGVYCLRIGCSALINKECCGCLPDDNAGLATKRRCECMKRPWYLCCERDRWEGPSNQEHDAMSGLLVAGH